MPGLGGARTVLVTAARADRAAVGGGSESAATWFGRAWLVDGLNPGTSFIGAYDIATREISHWEHEDGEVPSLPQIDVGDDIRGPLQGWQAQLETGAAVPYPYDTSEERRVGEEGVSTCNSRW